MSAQALASHFSGAQFTCVGEGNRDAQTLCRECSGLSVLGFLEILDNTNVIMGCDYGCGVNTVLDTGTVIIAGKLLWTPLPLCSEAIKSRAHAVTLGDCRSWASAVHHCGF